MDSLKKMIIIFTAIILFILALTVGVDIYKKTLTKIHTKRLIEYLENNEYKQLNGQNFYEKVEKGLSQFDYTQSSTIPKSSDVYTYSNEFKIFTHQISETTKTITADFYFEYSLKENKIKSYYDYSNDKYGFIKGIYNVKTGEFTCTTVTDEENKQKDACSYLRNNSISLDKKLDNLLSESNVKLKYLK